MMLNICIIGAGRAGLFHINNVIKHPNININYVIDKNGQKAFELSKIYNCSFHTDIKWVLTNIEFDSSGLSSKLRKLSM